MKDVALNARLSVYKRQTTLSFCLWKTSISRFFMSFSLICRSPAGKGEILPQAPTTPRRHLPHILCWWPRYSGQSGRRAGYFAALSTITTRCLQQDIFSQVYLFSELNRSLPIIADYKDIAAVGAWFDAHFTKTDGEGSNAGEEKSPSTPKEMSPEVMGMKLKANRMYESKLFNQAIELYNSALVRNYHPILLANRAAALMKRNW